VAEDEPPAVPADAPELRKRKQSKKRRGASKRAPVETEEQAQARKAREEKMEKEYQMRRERENAECMTSLVAMLAGFLISAVLAALAMMVDDRVDRSMPMAVGLIVLVASALYHSFCNPSSGSTMDEEPVHPIVWVFGGAGLGCMMGALAGDIIINTGAFA